MKTIVAGTAKCQFCELYGELRPYGPNQEWICFPCAMKDEAETRRQFGIAMDGGLVIDARNNGEIE